MPLINNKMKQAVGGNWGKPQKIEQHIKLKNFAVEREQIPSKKKIKKVKQKYICPGDCCPFCHNELPVDKTLSPEIIKANNGEMLTLWPFDDKVKQCPNCKALGDQECPACKHKTWYSKGTYKHQWMGCGFEGNKKYLQ